VDRLVAYLRGFGTDEDGATVLEYALLLVLIMLVCVAGIAAIGNITNVFFTTANTL
jgi:Flp pilus assembly pilin Flp